MYDTEVILKFARHFRKTHDTFTDGFYSLVLFGGAQGLRFSFRFRRRFGHGVAFALRRRIAFGGAAFAWVFYGVGFGTHLVMPPARKPFRPRLFTRRRITFDYGLGYYGDFRYGLLRCSGRGVSERATFGSAIYEAIYKAV
jgi:hypothetical protein